MAYTRRPRGCREETWWRGQSQTAKILAEELIDAAAWKAAEVFDAGRVVMLEAGDSLFSLSKLVELTGGSLKQVRDARDSLKACGFLAWSRPFQGGEARCLYHVSDWWKFIEPPKADETLGSQDSDEKGAVKGHNGDWPSNGNGKTHRKQKGQSRGSQRAQQPSRVSRVNVQSAEHRTTEPLQLTGTRTRSSKTPPPETAPPLSVAPELLLVSDSGTVRTPTDAFMAMTPEQIKERQTVLLEQLRAQALAHGETFDLTAEFPDEKGTSIAPWPW